MSFLKKLPLWKKIALAAVISLIIVLASVNHLLLKNIVYWLGILWRTETAIVVWRTMEKPFWLLLIIRSCCDVWGILLTWWLTGLTLRATQTIHQHPGVFGRLARKLRKGFEKRINNSKSQKRLTWLKNKEAFILYLAMLIPYWPFLPTAITIVVRMRQLKRALLILIILNAIRNTTILLLIWKGISLFK